MLLPPQLRSRVAPLVRAADAALFVRGPGGAAQRHAHHWWHLVIGLAGPLRACGPEGVWVEAPGVLTPPDVPHAIEAHGDVALVFVEPDSRLGARLAAAHGQPALRVLSELEAGRVRVELEREEPAPIEAVLDVVCAALGIPEAGPARKHPAVARVLRHLESAAPDTDVSLAALAAVADMSPGRLMHAFTEHVGLPLRPYVRWLRLRRAAAALLGGASMSEAAHATGFADAAHMTRTFRAMFGVTPTELSRRSQSVQSS